MKLYLLLILLVIGLQSQAQVATSLKAPEANDDIVRIQSSIVPPIIILKNDKDKHGNQATLDNINIPVLISSGKDKDAAINVKGELVYTPQVNFSGIDTLTYKICDPDNADLCDTAYVYIIGISEKLDENPLYEWLEKYVTVRRSLEDANLQSKPAEFGFFEPLSGTNPQGNKGYFQLNGVLGLNLSQKSSTTLTNASVSYNRNSGLKEPQNSLAAGINILNIKRYGEWSGIGVYRRDYHKKSQSAHAILQLSPIWGGSFPPFNMNMSGPDTYNPKTNYKRLKFFYGFTVGLENEYRFEVAPENANEEGNYIRPLFKGSIRINPWYVNDRISLYSNYYWRYDVYKPDSYVGSRRHPLFEAGIDLGLVDREKTSAMVGLSYKNGDNPIEGLQKNEFWSLVLKVKI